MPVERKFAGSEVRKRSDRFEDSKTLDPNERYFT